MFDIAVIGAGANGIALLKHIEDMLYSESDKKIAVALIDTASHFARGKAFGDTSPHHKVNTPPTMLAIGNYEPNNFSKFVYQSSAESLLFPVRRSFADYLSITIEGIKKRNILDLTEIRAECTDIDYKNNYILYAGDNTIEAKEIVLCLGSVSETIFSEFSQLPNFHNHHNTIGNIQNESAIIAGTGLSAIDLFRSANKNKNKVYMYSRHGFLPTCITKKNNYIPDFVDWSYIQNHFTKGISSYNFVELLFKEEQHIGKKSEYKEGIKILRSGTQQSFFAYLQARAMAGDTPFQDTLVYTRPFMHRLWRSFSCDDRYWFMQNHGAFWAAWRHPIPCEVIEEIKNALEDGSLEIHQANTQPIFNNNVFSIEMSNGKKISTKHFIDGTGGGNQLSQQTSRLIQNLMARGFIKPHPCGGIDVDPLSYNCLSDEPFSNRLFSIGPLNKGALFSTNAFWFNSRCAYIWARNWYIRNSLDKTL